LFALHARIRRGEDQPSRARNLVLVRNLGLTDLCLFTEARYTRNPSQADHYAAFQDHPMALEHFPAGSLVGLPAWENGRNIKDADVGAVR